MLISHHHSQHHRRNSSVTSLSASAAKYPEKIERLQAFDKWRHLQTDLNPGLMITTIYVHLSHRTSGHFVIECCSPSGHWMVEKSLKDLRMFQKNLDLAFPVEAGATGKPRILPKLLFPKCPKWLLLKKEIFGWYRYQIEKFMRLVLECSLLIAKSRLVEEFLESGLLNTEEEMEELSGKKMSIGTPMSVKNVLRCELGQVNLFESGESIVTVLYNNEVFPLVNKRSLAELEQTFSFLIGDELQFYAVDKGEKVLLNNDNFHAFCGSNNNQLLYLEVLHE